MLNGDEFYTKCLNSFQNITKKSTQFLKADEDFCDSIKTDLKSIYDYTKQNETKNHKSALKNLLVDNFNLEQIWQQLELQNDSLITSTVIAVSKLVTTQNKIAIRTEEEKEESENESDNDSIIEENSEEEIIEEEEELPQNTNEVNRGKKSIVDDDFFKLSEMEEFLEKEETKDTESDSDEESVNLFDEEEEEENEDDGKTARFKDFFVQKEQTRPKHYEEEESAFEQRQHRLKQVIEEIEEDAVGEKPWQLKGEITAENRPYNSLLEEIVEFDLSTRPAPVITEQTTFQLEDIIKQRIKDKVFDSVVRKTKPTETPLEYKKKLVLEQEKSKESLAQIYEREYLEQKAALNNDVDKPETEPELHKEINKMMKNLFNKLDALSNFHFTPKPAIAELKIVSNLPAVSMEEVTPVAMSDAALLAPEEIKRRMKGDEIGKSERTDGDKNRERRKKKLKQKMHAKIQQTKVGVNKGLKKNGKKEQKNETIDKSYSSLKSSKAFFTQLEAQVKSQINSKVNTSKRSKTDLKTSAKRLKL